MTKPPRLTKADAVIPAINHDGLVAILRFKLQILTQPRDVLTSLFLTLLGLLNALRHRAK
ncbi:hypothetical protein D3C76_1805970 [compost metagenome]